MTIPHRLPRNQCAFCHSSPTSEEHIWPDWLLKAADKKFPPFVEVIQYNDGEKKRIKYPRSVVRRACEPCNNGWMSKLEAAARPIMEPMFFRTRPAAPLTPADLEIVARWAYKTALMTTFLYAAHLEPAVYEGFYRDRQPPMNGCAIWMAEYAGPEATYTVTTREGHFTEPPSTGTDGAPVPGQTWTAYRITLWALSLVFQVLLVPEMPSLVDAFDSDWAPRIWPARDRVLGWPPRRSLANTAAIELFSGGQPGTFGFDFDIAPG